MAQKPFSGCEPYRGIQAIFLDAEVVWLQPLLDLLSDFLNVNGKGKEIALFRPAAFSTGSKRPCG